MRLVITPYDGRPRRVDWPSDQRVPVAGELMLVRSGTFRVDMVQWEQQGPEWVAHLRVVSC